MDCKVESLSAMNIPVTWNFW